MKRILVTGARGFVGRNLCAVLRSRENIVLLETDIENPKDALEDALAGADIIFHLAGVNRPDHIEDFEKGNADLLATLCETLRKIGRAPKIVLSSSIQADLDNAYGRSKRHAEEILSSFCRQSNGAGVVYRLKNLFGKWCRPNYNSVTATFCHNIANDIPIHISDRANVLELTHIDTVVKAFASELDQTESGFRFAASLPATRITLGELADKLYFYRQMRETLLIPDFQSEFERALYGTYLSYMNEERFDYSLDIKADRRGSLAEFIKAPALGQIFVSRTKPGIIRGDHYHHTKTEKFLVVQGSARIRFRHIERKDVIEYKVCGEDYRVLDIPPGYTHSIENVGDDELVTLFWACEMFDARHPDTCYEKVQPPRT